MFWPVFMTMQQGEKTSLPSSAQPKTSSCDLSVVMVNYNSALLTKASVQSVQETLAGSGIQYEIFVFDNASADDSVEVLAADIPGIHWMASQVNLGFGRAVNIAIRRTEGRYVLLLNPDVIALPGAIKALLDFADRHPRAAVVAGRLYNPNGTVQASAPSFYTPLTVLYRRTLLGQLPWARRYLNRVLTAGTRGDKPRQVDWVLGACMLVRRRAIEEVGSMDPRFFLYFEDMDWCRRFWSRGWEVWYVPAARFTHYHKRESAQERGLRAFFNPLARVHIASGVKYFWKYRREGYLPPHCPSARERLRYTGCQ